MLQVRNLHARVDEKEILKGLDIAEIGRAHV